MRITHLTVENFRSIRKLELVDIPSVAVFYGPNGAGKSNILAAVGLAWRCFLAHLGYGVPDAEALRERFSGATEAVKLGFCLTFDEHEVRVRDWRAQSVEFTVTDKLPAGPMRIQARHPEGRSVDRTTKPGVVAWESAGPTPDFPEAQAWSEALRAALTTALFPVAAVRGAPRGESPDSSIPELARDGHFETAAFKAQVSPDAEMAARLFRLQQLLAGPPLHRLPFRPVDLGRGLHGLQEVRQVDRRSVGFALESLGLGLQQIYPILGGIFLSGASIVTLEEPEAHLHAPTTGAALRQILKKLVPDPVNQLFVATHSEQFDLNPDGYYDVRLDEALGTVVEWRTDLVDIDRRHTYSPGGARHALLDVLKRSDRNRVVYLRPDGAPVLAREMVKMLVDDEAEAQDYLRLVTESAVRAVAVKARARAEGA